MAAIDAGTLVNTPRRDRSVGMWGKRRSSMFSQEAAVGVK
jgi:hypothetical protein